MLPHASIWRKGGVRLHRDRPRRMVCPRVNAGAPVVRSAERGYQAFQKLKDHSDKGLV